MIINRTPYRIPLAGGGTDHKFYYKKNGGLLLSATFNQYVYTLITERKIDTKNFSANYFFSFLKKCK